MDAGYHSAQRNWQDRFDTRRLADRLAEASSDTISDVHRAFIEARDMFFIATADSDGVPQCSYKGGRPGFVQVLDRSNIAFPVYDGNGMFLTSGNLVVNPLVGILFIDFETGTRLRLNGTASIGVRACERASVRRGGAWPTGSPRSHPLRPDTPANGRATTALAAAQLRGWSTAPALGGEVRAPRRSPHRHVPVGAEALSVPG